MNEAYVKFDVAKLLKEKGFDWECHHFYYCKNNGKIVEKWMCFIADCNSDRWINQYAEYISAPTQQMACRWLREVHKIFISIGVGTDIDGVFGYMPSIYFLSILSCNEGRFVPNVDADDICNSTPKTYEDAVEAALEYVLKNLI